jgi:hypothetical protein
MLARVTLAEHDITHKIEAQLIRFWFYSLLVLRIVVERVVNFYIVKQSKIAIITSRCLEIINR